MKSPSKDQSWAHNCLVISFRWEVCVRRERNCYVSYPWSFSDLEIIESLQGFHAHVRFGIYTVEGLSIRFQVVVSFPVAQW